MPIVALSVLCAQLTRDLLEIAKFLFHTPLHSAPPLGGSPSEYRHPVWYMKTRLVELSDGGKTLSICVTVYTQYRRVTDGRTGRQTSCHIIVRAMHMRRAVKIFQYILFQAFASLANSLSVNETASSA